ncbi:alpha/beta hydrolase family protein [Candidatus Latescibacterota bacterium]
MKKLLCILFIFAAQNVSAQGVTPGDWCLKEFHIKHEELGDIYYYVTEEGIETEKPLIFAIQGSGGIPSMIYVKFGEKSTQFGMLPADFISRFSDTFHVAYMAKPGTAFCDTIVVEELNPVEILENYQPTEEYIRNCDLERQVNTSSIVIDELSKKLSITDDKIIIAGISEGGRIVPPLAAMNSKVTHAVCMVSGGLNQFYSSIINNRMDAAAGKITHHEAQEKIDELFAIYENIYKEPTSTDKFYYGHSYKRWGSFCNDIPLEHFLKLDIPIYMLNGSTDRNTPILQADYIKLEFLRIGKSNLTYDVLPGVDHSLYEVVVEDGEEKGISHRDEAFKKVIDWIKNN